jgi:O-antigen/teichoic acid export membrane protein
MTREGSGALIVRNTLVNGGAAVFGVLVFLVLTPVMILQLGAEAYGVFTLSLTLSFLGGYASLTDLGVEASTARYIAEARSDGDVHRVNQLASTTMVFFGLAALVLGPVVVALAYPLVSFFDVPSELHDAAVLCFALTGAQLFFEMPARTYFSVLEGAQRFAAYQACEVTRIVSQALMFVLTLTFDLGIGALGGALAVSSLLVLLLSRHLAHRLVPELRVSPRLATRATFRVLVTYGGGLVGFRLMNVAYRQMDRVIIGAALGPSSVTIYEIANKIQSSAQMVQSVSASVLVPATAFARANLQILRDMFVRGTAYALAVSVPTACAVIIFAEPLIRTWISPEYTEAASTTRLFAVYLLMAGVLAVGTTMVVALGHLRFLLMVNGAAVLGNLVLSLLLVHPLGINGVVLGSVISYALVFPLQLRYFRRQFGVSFKDFGVRIALPQLPGVAAQALTALPLLWLADRTDSVFVAAALAGVSILCSLAAFLALGLRGEHRDVLLSTLRQAVR